MIQLGSKRGSFTLWVGEIADFELGKVGILLG
jgi:hypothetical protein